MASYVRSNPADDRQYVLHELTTVRAEETARSHPLITKLRALVPFENISLSGLDLEGCQFGKGIFLATDMPGAFIDEYRWQKFVEVDPLVRIARAEAPVARWDAIDTRDLAVPEAATLLASLQRHNVPPRTVITFWRGQRFYGAAVFARQKSFSEAEISTLKLFAEPLHAELSTPIISRANRRFGLSNGELICLKLAANGLTADEIASEAKYSPDTVSTYLKSVIQKLGAANRTHAVAIAMRRSIIT